MTVDREALAAFKMTNLERGLRILELLVDYPEGLGTSEMARKLELPKNFVFRATSVLHLKGYLERNEDSKTFGLSRKLLSMSYHVLKHTSLVEISMPVMRALSQRAKETVTLCALEGVQGIVLDHVPSPHAMRMVADSGAHFHLHASAPGKALLAFMADEERTALIDQLSFTRFTDSTITDPQQFRQELERTLQRGYSVDFGEEMEGIRCVAAPIFDERQRVVAALVVTGPTLRVQEERIPEFGSWVQQAAAEISTKLGDIK